MLINLSLYDFPKNESNTSHTCEKNRPGPACVRKNSLALAGTEQKPLRKNKSKLAATMQQWQLKHGEQQADQTHSRRKARRSRRPVGGLPCLQPNCR
jgi:hypothetical protein